MHTRINYRGFVAFVCVRKIAITISVARTCSRYFYKNNTSVVDIDKYFT